MEKNELRQIILSTLGDDGLGLTKDVAICAATRLRKIYGLESPPVDRRVYKDMVNGGQTFLDYVKTGISITPVPREEKKVKGKLVPGDPIRTQDYEYVVLKSCIVSSFIPQAYAPEIRAYIEAVAAYSPRSGMPLGEDLKKQEKKAFAAIKDVKPRSDQNRQDITLFLRTLLLFSELVNDADQTAKICRIFN
jgi:hypothetical protein